MMLQKRFSLLVFFVMVSFIGSISIANAQITINAGNFPGDDIGHEEQYFVGYDVTVDLGSAGGNQTWDFSEGPTEETEWSRVVDAESVPGHEEFPEAEVAVEGVEQSYAFCAESSEGFTFYGGSMQVMDSTQIIAFDNPAMLIRFPMTYGSSWTDSLVWSFSYEFMPGIVATMTHTEIEEVTVDAWGTVTIPAGTYPCLRARSDRTTITETVIPGFPPQTFTETYIDYEWVAEDMFTLVSISSQAGETDPDFTDAESIMRLYSLTDIDTETATLSTPQNTVLQQNVPNPFNPTTTITYSIATPNDVHLAIYDVNGRLIKTLVNDWQSAGQYSINWNGTNEDGQAVNSGIYFYQMTTSQTNETKSMVLLK